MVLHVLCAVTGLNMLEYISYGRAAAADVFLLDYLAYLPTVLITPPLYIPRPNTLSFLTHTGKKSNCIKVVVKRRLRIMQMDRTILSLRKHLFLGTRHKKLEASRKTATTTFFC